MSERLDVIWQKAFERAWYQQGFRDIPIAHFMRTNPQNHWVRFHSFDDKRYPETHADEEAVFNRFRSVSEKLAERESTVFVVHAYFSGEEDEVGEPKYNWDVRETSWQVEDWRQLVIGVSWDQRTDFYGFFFPTEGRFISPYDGGMDVFLETSETCDFLKNQFSAWLSPREDGL